ncbi:MAG: antitoxin [bacterium]|nr:antitoxin [bacterium]
MQTTLTLQLDERIMQYAQTYAKQQGKSVSQIVSEYLALLKDQTEKTPQPVPPITQSLRGVLRGVKLDEQDYKRYLEEKHM